MSFLKKLFGAKDKPILTTADFWNWFQQHEKTFFKVVKEGGNIERDFFDKLSPKLNELREGLLFVTGMYDDNTAELIITAEGMVKYIAFAREIVDSAPNIDGWKFTALKQALDIADVSIKMQGKEFNKENIHFYSNDIAEYPDEINITLVHDDYNEMDKTLITNGVYIFLDNLLGEANSVSIIDFSTVIGKADAERELIPIGKLNDFLTWRQKEFIEKYEGVRYDTANDNYSILEAKLKTGNMLLAVINTDLMQWDAKASHPWMLNVEMKYDGSQNNGMPDDEIYQLLGEIEDEILNRLKDYDGYLNIGRQTADNLREIYFACKTYAKPSKVMDEIAKKYAGKIEVEFDIFKDKYWMSLNRFVNN